MPKNKRDTRIDVYYEEDVEREVERERLVAKAERRELDEKTVRKSARKRLRPKLKLARDLLPIVKRHIRRLRKKCVQGPTARSHRIAWHMAGQLINGQH